jgi:hypothetical protein
MPSFCPIGRGEELVPDTCFIRINENFFVLVELYFFLCTQKMSTLLKSVSVSVRPSVRLSDNSSQLHPIELKFCVQNYLINISVEFEDENDPSRNGWVIEKIVIFDQTIPEGGYRDFFKKNIFNFKTFQTFDEILL